jgi:Protein of unknown function (DUF2812)
MNEKTIRKFHIFLSWQDEAQERWLAEMSRKGLHLMEPQSLGRYLFVEGPAREYAYRLDFNKDKPSDAYLQLIQDAGWEHLGKREGWYYWRQVIKAGRVPEIFSDAQSKRQKYDRLLAFYATSAPGAAVIYILNAAWFKNFPGRIPLWLVITVFTLCLAWLLYAGINALMVLLRRKALAEKASAKKI